KASAIGQASINIALGITKALGQGNLLLAGLIAIAGGTQIAAIASEPLPEMPQFEKGTLDAPAGDKIVSEKGSEMVVTPSGEIKMTPKKKTKVDDRFIPKGSAILPADQTSQILRDMKIIDEKAIYSNHAQNNNAELKQNDSYAELLNIIKRDSTRLDQIAKEFKDQAIFNFEVTSRGVQAMFRKGQSSTTYINQKYKR
ncbi:MAG: hypothetical protein WD512_18750, partial [Candidatus Paceibacterota bacterium]